MKKRLQQLLYKLLLLKLKWVMPFFPGMGNRRTRSRKAKCLRAKSTAVLAAVIPSSKPLLSGPGWQAVMVGRRSVTHRDGRARGRGKQESFWLNSHMCIITYFLLHVLAPRLTENWVRIKSEQTCSVIHTFLLTHRLTHQLANTGLSQTPN